MAVFFMNKKEIAMNNLIDALLIVKVSKAFFHEQFLRPQEGAVV